MQGREMNKDENWREGVMRAQPVYICISRNAGPVGPSFSSEMKYCQQGMCSWTQEHKRWVISEPRGQ